MGILEFFSLESLGQGRMQLDELALAFILSSLIGLEREFKLKSAGLRTHALVGLGAGLLMIVSKYGFADILQQDHVSLDPSRVAAQIVSGIGFIGGGLIFVRKDIVHGLTTAATIWLSAGVGMACGGGLPLLAAAATAGHFVVAFGYTRLMRRAFGASNRLNIRYTIGEDVAAKILALCTAHNFTLRSFTMKSDSPDVKSASMIVRIQGHKSPAPLMERIMQIPGVVSVNSNPSQEED